jgi:signal peptidase II
VAADQLTKFWVRSNLAPHQSIPEEGFLQITHVKNTGAAFGLFTGQTLPLIITALVGIAALLLCYRYPPLDTTLSRSALGLLLGGTVGNLADRLRLGYVTDFIDIGIWPAFNIADSAIVVGASILAFFFLRLGRGHPPEDR